VDSEAHEGLPLLGALLLEQGLITAEQLQVCLQLQSEHYLGIPLGQILVNCGYLSRTDLAHILILRDEIKASLMTSVGTQLEPPADFSAVLVYHDSVPQLLTLLQHYGVAARALRSWDELAATWAPADLLLVDPRFLDSATDLSPYAGVTIVPLAPLPEAANGVAAFPPWAELLLIQLLTQLRVQREEQADREHLREDAADLAILTVLSRIVTAKAHPQQMLSQLVILIRDHLLAAAGVLYRLDAANRALVPEVAFGPALAHLPPARIGLHEGVAGWVARRRKSLLLADVLTDPRFDRHVDQLPGMTTQTILAMPLIACGTVQGVLTLLNKSDRASFTLRDLAFLRIGASVAGLILAMGGNEARSESRPEGS
jgi:hypothetical protein